MFFDIFYSALYNTSTKIILFFNNTCLKFRGVFKISVLSRLTHTRKFTWFCTYKWIPWGNACIFWYLFLQTFLFWLECKTSRTVLLKNWTVFVYYCQVHGQPKALQALYMYELKGLSTYYLKSAIIVTK